MADMKASVSYLRYLSDSAPNEIDRRALAALADDIEHLRAKVAKADEHLERALERLDIARDNAAWWKNMYTRLLARSVIVDD